MAKTTRNNATAKGHQSYLASAKAMNPRLNFEYRLAHATKPEQNPIDQWEAKELFDRRGQHRGATKCTHTMHPDGWYFETIVVKRIRLHAAVQLGNQGKFEARTWEHFATTPEADLLCPVLRWWGSKSDKVLENSEKDRDNLVMVCQKAVATGTARQMCVEAERLNRQNGLNGESANRRLAKLEALASEQGWWDVLHNGGNSGVIYDYGKGIYKAVFIDYAL